MRYLVQFAIPVTILAVVLYLLIRNPSSRRGSESGDVENTNDTASFLLILIIGATVAVLSLFALQDIWG